MSGNSAPKTVDRRVVRTRERLGDALIALILEKGFDAITVQDVLDRAEIGRSTFYAHYRDMDDLFVSDIDDFLGAFANALASSNEHSRRVACVREFFAHISDGRQLGEALRAAGRWPDIVDLGRAHFARAIAARLAEIPPADALSADRRAALGHAYAGAFFSLLEWWIESEPRMTPAEADDMFHRMVWSGV